MDIFSQFSINHILEKIFDYLSLEDIKSCRMVSNQWRDLTRNRISIKFTSERDILNYSRECYKIDSVHFKLHAVSLEGRWKLFHDIAVDDRYWNHLTIVPGCGFSLSPLTHKEMLEIKEYLKIQLPIVKSLCLPQYINFTMYPNEDNCHKEWKFIRDCITTRLINLDEIRFTGFFSPRISREGMKPIIALSIFSSVRKVHWKFKTWSTWRFNQDDTKSSNEVFVQGLLVMFPCVEHWNLIYQGGYETGPLWLYELFLEKVGSTRCLKTLSFNMLESYCNTLSAANTLLNCPFSILPIVKTLEVVNPFAKNLPNYSFNLKPQKDSPWPKVFQRISPYLQHLKIKIKIHESWIPSQNISICLPSMGNLKSLEIIYQAVKSNAQCVTCKHWGKPNREWQVRDECVLKCESNVPFEIQNPFKLFDNYDPNNYPKLGVIRIKIEDGCQTESLLNNLLDILPQQVQLELFTLNLQDSNFNRLENYQIKIFHLNPTKPSKILVPGLAEINREYMDNL